MTLSVADFVKAYEETNLTPRQSIWYEPQTNCACGLSAVLVHKYPEQRHTYETITINNHFGDKSIREYLSEKLGVSRSFLLGFTLGFDGNTVFVRNDPDKTKGYDLGKQVWEAVSCDKN